MEYILKRSRRRTLQLEINAKAQLIVRAPMNMKAEDINEYIELKSDWIHNAVSKVEARIEKRSEEPLLYAKDIRELTIKARKVMPEKCSYYGEIIGVNYGKITIRQQSSRWGSCSSKGNLNFNCLLMLTPDEIIDYVVVHELCHRIYMNHSKAFWNEVGKVIPDYKRRERWLKDNGNSIIERVHRREDE